MFEGIFTAVITPMKGDGSIEWGLWEAQLRRQIDAGIHGLIIGGTTGEYYALSDEERIEQFNRAGKIAGRTPWLAGVNGLTTAGACKLARAAKAAGASGLLIAAPPYSVPTEAELAAHCIAIDEAADLPITLYNYPGRTGVDMGDVFKQAIRGRRNFVNIKESTGDIKRAIAHQRDYPEIKLCCGAEDLALDFFVWGAKMWICAVSNFDPARIIALYDACVLRGDFIAGRRIAGELSSLMATFEDGGKFIASTKYACARQGLCEPHLRGPLGPLTEEETRRLDAILDTLPGLAMGDAA